MLRRYIGVLIGEMRGRRMPVLPTPYIPGKDRLIRRHASKYMPAPPGSAGSWGYALLDDWAQDPILGYVLVSLAD